MGLAKGIYFDGDENAFNLRLPLQEQRTVLIGRGPIYYTQGVQTAKQSDTPKHPYDSARYTWKHPSLPLQACFREEAIDFFVTPEASLCHYQSFFPEEMSGSRKNFKRYLTGFEQINLCSLPRIAQNEIQFTALNEMDNYATSSGESCDNCSDNDDDDLFSATAFLD